jgi:long-chain acyl-CoA synthetase
MMLLRHPDIEQVCVVGMGVPQPIALVVLSAAGKAKSKDEIAASLGAAIASVNGQLEAYEQLKTAVVMREDWTIENGLLTPTLKVRRNEVEKIYLPHYSKWYLQQGTVVWA